MVLLRAQCSVKYMYRVCEKYIYGDSGGICNTLGNDSLCDSKQKIHMNMGPILNGYRDYGKKKIRTILRARTAIT